MSEEGDEGTRVNQSEPDAAASTSANADASSAGNSRRTSLNKSGTRTPRFDLAPMTEYFDSSPATPDNEASDDEERLGWSRRSDGGEDSPPASRTPTFNQSYNNLRRNLSMKSLRELEIKHFQRAAWRKKDEPRKRPRDLEQLVIYAATGGARGSCPSARFYSKADAYYYRRLYPRLYTQSRSELPHHLHPAVATSVSVMLDLTGY